MKKALALLISILLIILVMAGCGQGSATKDTTFATTASTTSENSTGTENIVTEINFLIMPDLEKYTLYDLFMSKNPDIKINREVLPFDKMFEAINIRLSAGDKGIDVLLVDVPVVSNYAAKGYITPLDSLVTPESKTRITKSSLEACTINGKLMALPNSSSCVNLYFNIDIFKEMGITPPENDTTKRWTWEEVVEVAKKLTYTKDGKLIWGLTFEQNNRPYQLLPLAQSLGAQKLVSDDGLITTGFTNSPEMIKGAQFYYDTFNTWKISPKLPADQTTELFASGQVAMFVGGPWRIGKFQSANLNFGFAPHPYFKDGVPVTPTGSWCIGVSAYSENKEAAAKFVEFFTTDDEASIEKFKNGGQLPCNIAVLQNIEKNPDFSEFPKNAIKLAVYESIYTSVPRPQLAGYDEWQTIMTKTYTDIMNGAQPKEALDSAVAEIDKQLQKYRN